jgi:hypothetical protein
MFPSIATGIAGFFLLAFRIILVDNSNMENQTIANRIRARLEHLGKNPSAVAL